MHSRVGWGPPFTHPWPHNCHYSPCYLNFVFRVPEPRNECSALSNTSSPLINSTLLSAFGSWFLMASANILSSFWLSTNIWAASWFLGNTPSPVQSTSSNHAWRVARSFSVIPVISVSTIEGASCLYSLGPLLELVMVLDCLP